MAQTDEVLSGLGMPDTDEAGAGAAGKRVWRRLRLLLLPLPGLLVVFRALCAPLAILLAAHGDGEALALLILLATLSDVADGIIARRLGVASELLRRADSIVDLGFWLCVIAALLVLRPADMTENWPVIAAGLAAEVVQQGISVARFGRLSATHARSAKLLGLCLMVGFMLLAFGGSSAVAFWIIAKGIALSALDGILIVLLLPRWEADIPSAWAALQRRRGRPIERHWLW